MRRALGWLALFTMFGCDGEGAPPGALALDTPVLISFDGPVTGQLRVRVTSPLGEVTPDAQVASLPSGPTVMPIAMSLATGKLRLETREGRAYVDDLDVPLGNLRFGEGVVAGGGLTFNRVALDMTERTRVAMLDARPDRMVVAVAASFHVDWGFEFPGGKYYMLGPLPFVAALLIETKREDDVVTSRVIAHCGGACAEIAGLLLLEDLELELSATAMVEPLPRR